MDFHEALGVEVHVGDGTATVRLEAEQRHLNGHGSVHGGVLASLADIAMGAVVNATTERDAAPVTVTLVMTYLEPAPAGTITATATITRQGKRLTITGAELTADDGTTVATAIATFTTV